MPALFRAVYLHLLAMGIDLISVAANAGYKAKNPLPYNPANESPDVWAVFDAFSNVQ